MRVAVSCALALLAVGVSSPEALRPAGQCAAPTDHETARPKASSFAPHPGAQNRVYGAPIQPRILKSRPKKNPGLRSAPLPEA